MGVATMRVPTIFTAVDRFSSVVSKMTMGVSAFGKTAEAAAMRTSRKFNSVGTDMLTAGATVAVGLGYAINEAVKFEKAMSNVSTTIDSTPELMKNMSDSILEMSKKIPVPISQLTEALYDVVSAGIASEHAMTVLGASGRLGVAGLGTAKEGVDVITSSLNAFNIKATESEKVANMVFKAVKYGKTTVSGLAESFGSSAALVKNSNVSLEEYLATTATLTTTGMTASRAQTQVASAVTALIKPSGTMSKIFSKLGVKDVPQWIKNNGGLVKSLKIVRDEGEKMGLLSSKAFGRKEGFSAMLSLLGPLADKFKLVYGDIMNSNDSLTESFEKQQKTFSAKFQIMKNKATGLAIAIGNELMPRVSGFMDSIAPIITGMTKWISKNEGLVTTILNITLGLLAFGMAAKVAGFLFLGYAKILTVVSAITKAYTFVSTMAALANVSFATALWGVVTAIWAFLWPILLVVVAIGALIWVVIDMVQHWSDWNDVVLLVLGPLGQVILLMQKIEKHSSNIQNMFAFEGWGGGIRAIGTMLEDMILSPLIGIFNIMGRIPLIGSPFKEMASDLDSVRTKIPSEIPLGKIGMQGTSNFSTFGGIMPEWDTASKPKNLSGKNQSNTDAIMTAMNKGGVVTVNFNDPNGVVKDANSDNPSGIVVRTSSTKKGYNDNN